MFAEVIVSITHKEVDKVFHYHIPEAMERGLKIGMRVSVPFGLGNKKIEGYVIGFSEETDIAFDKLKAISSIAEEYPVFSEKMIALAKWMKGKYYTTLSECLQCILPAGLGTRELSVKYVYLNQGHENFSELYKNAVAKNDKKSEIIKLLAEEDGMALPVLKKRLACSDSPIQTLKKNGLITIKPFPAYRDPFKGQDFPKTENLVPNMEQARALSFLREKLNAPEKQSVLLHGVTGSGKTEIYLQLIEDVLNEGKQAIVLVPEISLTPQTVNRFKGRFSSKVSVTHSRLSPGERFDQWRKAREGLVSVMIGPRSAIFTPFDNLGIIIIDEEHEHTYQSESTPKYDARAVAEKLMTLTNCLVVYGTATPSVETFFRAKEGEIGLFTLHERVNKKPPDVHVVDMRQELAGGNRSVFSEPLYRAIEQNLRDKNQTILFMNRRGYSTFVSCRSCGYVLQCDGCNINYTYHIYADKLLCHYCGKEEKTPENCPVCGSKHVKFFGAGTQKIEEELKKFFPEARVLRMDMDTTSQKHGHQKILALFAEGKADILIGTQMIAKGHDFPRVSLVGIIAADMALNNGDFRSAETAFQLITQVSGRAGRAELDGEVFIQTYNPEHYSIEYAKESDYAAFYDHEILIRQQMAYPPFTHIFNILFTGEDERKLIISLNHLHAIMNHYNKKNQFELLGPSPAQLSKINKNYRWRLFVKCADEEKIKSFVFYCLDKLKAKEDLSGITVNASLDPRVLN
ncbi:MAG: primosomal protein N' [Clostridiales bacterium]|jgi:primosomal protein N' (replication factor Y)|nr:primosomal protein N' [Clostridiales bacterium]